MEVNTGFALGFRGRKFIGRLFAIGVGGRRVGVKLIAGKRT